MKFIPRVVDRSRGDFVDPEEYNDNNRDIYVDLQELFERELALSAKTKILASMLDFTNAGIQRELREEELPPINFKNTTFIYPDEGARAEVDSFFGEITSGITEATSPTVDEIGKIRDGITIDRSSDNFIFTQIPKSVSETRIEDALEISEFPYLMRVKGIDEFVSLRMNIETTFGFMEMNTLEYIPFPAVGGSEIRDVDIIDETGQLFPIDDPAGSVINFSRDARDLYFPIRFITKPRNVDRFSIDVRSSLKVTGQDAIMAGVNQIRIIRNLYEPVSYIGFRIPSMAGKRLDSLKPVWKWQNTFLGDIKIIVYNSLARFNEVSNIFATTFNKEGVGLSVNIEKELFALAIITVEDNVSPQLTGFEWEINDV